MSKHLKLVIFAALLVLGVGLATACGSAAGATRTTTATTTPAQTAAAQPSSTEVHPMQWSTPPAMQIDPNKSYTAVLETAVGNINVELFAKDVPITVNNFVFLARQGFYDNTTFHRVIPGFMAQGGDPTGTGMGGPGYQFAQEITDHKHLAGTISMANAGPNTNGSQFFICYTAQPHLDGGYNVFGQVTDQASMDVLNKIAPRDPATATTPGTKLITVKIIEK